MANRYWVGGTATWNSSAGTKWSTTSGGAGGSAVPTIVDDVFLDAGSGSVTVSTSGALCRTVNTTGFSGTFNISGSLTVGGNVTFESTTTLSGTSILTVNNNSTIKYNNPTYSSSYHSLSLPSGVTYNVVSNLVLGAFIYSAGTLNAQNVVLDTRSGNNNWTSTTARTANLAGLRWILSASSTIAFPTSGLTINLNETTIVANNKANGVTKSINFRAANVVLGNLEIGTNGSIHLVHTGATNTNITVNNIIFTGNSGSFTVNTSTVVTITNDILSTGASAANVNWIKPLDWVATQSTVNAFGTINAASGTKVMERIILKDTVFSGGATFIANNSYDAGNNSGVTINAPVGVPSIAFSTVK